MFSPQLPKGLTAARCPPSGPVSSTIKEHESPRSLNSDAIETGVCSPSVYHNEKIIVVEEPSLVVKRSAGEACLACYSGSICNDLAVYIKTSACGTGTQRSQLNTRCGGDRRYT